MKQPLRFGVLGPMAIWDADGNAHQPAGREARALAALLMSPTRQRTIAELIATVWTSDPPASPNNALHNVMYRLRGVLAARDLNEAIEKNATGYRLIVDPLAIDAVRFEQLISAAKQAQLGDGVQLLTDAIELWRGSVLEGMANGAPDLAGEAQRLQALWWVALEMRIEFSLAAQQYRELIPELAGLTTKWPLRESLWTYLIAASYLADQRGQALQYCRRAGEALADEFGIDPSRSLQVLEQAIIDQNDEVIREVVQLNWAEA